MTAQRKRPKPIRLTKARALALLEVFDTGARMETEWILSEIQNAGDVERMRDAQDRDVLLAAAKDGAAIVRARYLDGEAPTEPTPTLF